MMRTLFLISCTLLVSNHGTAGEQYGAKRTNLALGKHQGFILEPRKPAMDSARPWVWYAPTIGAHPNKSNEWILKKLLDRGFYVCGVNVGESYGSPDGRKVFTEFHQHVVREYKLEPKARLLAQSRGGLMLYNWAAENPDKVQCIVGIYPVCDLRSYPGLNKAAGAYGMTPADLEKKLIEHNPIDRLEPLAKAKVPILHIHGDKDSVVPLDKNSQVVLDRYKALGGQMELIVVPGKGHAEILEFFQEPRLVQFLSDGGPGGAGDGVIGKLLRAQGAEVTEAKGLITAVTFKDASKLSDADFEQLTRLRHLKLLSISDGLNDARLAQLAHLAELEYLQTNLAQVTDDGIKPLAKLHKLKNLKFFHPGKSFSGAGLAHLATMPNLERLTVAGSLQFNDDGMAAVAKLPKLTEFRTWHAGATNEGVKKLNELKNLKSLYLGQRLTYKLPACPTDETIAILVTLKSLESLQLDEARFSLGALRQLKQLPALKKLTLGGVDIAKEDVERLRQELPMAKIDWTQPSEVYQKRIRALFGGK